MVYNDFLSMAAKYIEIIFNGIKEKVPAGTTIAELIVRIGEQDKHLIVECNNSFIHPHTYPVTTLNEGDRIEFINPDFGG
ncbi:MAG: sulfur carrier protein ThiS [Syntrophorhabdaceae bacterium]|nr:sulfur carrier protein ThiS [Syntrophorhabdaceae bacterium]